MEERENFLGDVSDLKFEERNGKGRGRGRSLERVR